MDEGFSAVTGANALGGKGRPHVSATDCFRTVLRPYRAWGYPVVPALMLVFAIALFIGYIVGNPRNSLSAVVLLAVSYPLYLLIRKTDVAKGIP